MKSIHSFSRFIWAAAFFFSLISTSFAGSPLRMAVINEGTFKSVNTDMSFLAPGDVFFWVFNDSADISSLGEPSSSPLAHWGLYSNPRFREAFDTFDCYTRYLMTTGETDEADTGMLVSRGGVLPIGSKPVKEPVLGRGGLDYLDMAFFKWNGISSPYWSESYIPKEWVTGKWVLLVTLQEGVRNTNSILRFKTSLDHFVSPAWYQTGVKQTFSGWQLFTLNTGSALLAGNARRFYEKEVIPVPLPVIKRRLEFQDIFNNMLRTHAPVVTYSWDIGSASRFKCEYCTGPPPRFEDIMQMQYDPGAIPANYYFTRIDGAVPEDWSLVSEEFMSYQLLFEGTHVSTGFLDCREKNEYLNSVKIREKTEAVVLETLVGADSARLFISPGE